VTETEASPPAPQQAPRPTPLLVVLTGPSGAGKDAVLDELARRGRRFHRVITATTRPPRDNERDGVDYFFLSDAAFDQLIDTGGLLEWARIYGHRSGVPKQQVLDRLEEGLDVYVRTDVQGADAIKRLMPDAVRIFIAPSSIEELEERIRARGSDSEDRVARRLAAAREEMARQHEFEHIIINYPNHLSETADQLEQVLNAERIARIR
jgi:guanylate kinase